MESSYDSFETKPSSSRGAKVAGIIINLIEFLLAFRFVFKLLGVSSTGSLFTSLIYGVTQPLVSPFLRALGVYQTNGKTLEWTTLLAMMVYWLIVWAIVKMFLTSSTVSTAEAERKIKQRLR